MVRCVLVIFLTPEIVVSRWLLAFSGIALYEQTGALETE